MSIFKSSNPTLTEKMWNRADGNIQAIGTETMTVRGAINKFGLLLLLVVGAAAYTWNLHAQLADSTMNTLMMAGIFGGLIVAIAISFKPTWAPFLAPLYAILEGFFLGGISVIFNAMFAEKYPGLIMQAVGLTFAVSIGMFLLYNFRIIKVTDKLRSVIISATVGILLFYIITMVLGFFHVNVGFAYDSSLLGIGISLFIVAIAALNLLLDFDMIERGAAGGAPKFMEWYGAFGLLVTIVWLYIEILKLLSRFAGRK